MAINPIKRDIIRNALATVADNMIVTVVQTARSPIVKNKLDFSTAICTAEGDLAGQGLALPAHLGAIMPPLKAVIEDFRGDINPGDVFINNDPYRGGSHLIDIFMFQPVFEGDDLIAFASIIIHHTDIGGRVAGGQASDNSEIYQEGLRIPPLKIVAAGKNNETVFKIIEANVRMPQRVIGDVLAQLASLRLAEKEMQKLIAEHGGEELTAYMADLIDHTEKLTRAAIAKLPDGVAEFEDVIDDDGVSDDPINIKCKLTIDGDEVTADFTGTSPQTKSSINPNVEFTQSCVYAAVRTVLDPLHPNNFGFHKPINIVTEPGSFVHPVFPAAFAARGLASHRVRQVVLGAMAKLMPERMPACYGGSECMVGFYGKDADGNMFLCNEGQNTTSLGGGPFGDGQDGAAFPLSNVANTPIELLEAENPLLVEEYGFLPDTGGPGRHRGGLGVVKQWRALADDTSVQLRSDRYKSPPWGLWGGLAGAPGRVTVKRRNGDSFSPPSKGRFRVDKDDVVRAEMPGAGGFEPAFDRAPAAVLDDVVQEKMSVEHARAAYGVVIDPETQSIDEAATADLRAASARSA